MAGRQAYFLGRNTASASGCCCTSRPAPWTWPATPWRLNVAQSAGCPRHPARPSQRPRGARWLSHFCRRSGSCSFNFAPKGWALCNGQAPADQPEPGTVLAPRAPPTAATARRPSRCRTCRGGRHPLRAGHTLGETGGEQAHTLTMAEMPTHIHPVAGRRARPRRQRQPPAGSSAAVNNMYHTPAALDAMNPRPSPTGGSQAHSTCSPSWCSPSASPSRASSRHRTQEGSSGTAIRGRDPDVRRQLRARWVDVLPGQLLPISENETSVQLIGTTYGGDGEAPSACPTRRAESRSHQGGRGTPAGPRPPESSR